MPRLRRTKNQGETDQVESNLPFAIVVAGFLVLCVVSVWYLKTHSGVRVQHENADNNRSDVDKLISKSLKSHTETPGMYANAPHPGPLVMDKDAPVSTLPKSQPVSPRSMDAVTLMPNSMVKQPGTP